MRTPTLVRDGADRRGRDRRRDERRRRREPVADDRRWPLERRRGDRRGSLAARLVRYVG